MISSLKFTITGNISLKVMLEKIENLNTLSFKMSDTGVGIS